MKTAYFTICSANYLPYARTLAESVATYEPGVDFYCFLMDDVVGRLDLVDIGFKCIEARHIGCENFYDMASRYTVMEMNTAIKPFCFQWLFEKMDYGAAAYIDPDIILTSRLDELHSAFGCGAAIVLTPHSLLPLNDGKDPDDVRLMRTGAYNLGFCGVRNSNDGRGMLKWWGDHLLGDCVVDLDNGLFVDQKFCDLVPCYFDAVSILRHPGYNVAYWNLLHREVKYAAGAGWTCNGEALRFFHFSGVVPGDPFVFSKHQDRFTVNDIGDVRLLLEYYLGRLTHHSYWMGEDLAKVPYAYATYANGLPYKDFMRRTYSQVYLPAARTYESAFKCDFAHQLMLAPDIDQQDSEYPVTRLMHLVWQGRTDLQKVFDLHHRGGQAGLFNWFIHAAGREHGLPEELLRETKDIGGSDPTLPSPRTTMAEINEESFLSSTFSGARRFAAQRKVPPNKSNALGMIGYFKTENGLGSAVRANYEAACEAGLDVEAFSIPAPGFESRLEFPAAVDHRSPTGDCVIIHVNADRVSKIGSEIDPRSLRGCHRIGYWAWELPVMPLEWIGAFNHIDEVWAPSQFAADAFASRTSKPVKVIPHPVAVSSPLSVQTARDSHGLPHDRFIFLAAFDLNSYIARKNPFAVVAAFSDAFQPTSESPILVLKLHGRHHRNSNFTRLMALVSKNPNIIVLDRVLDDFEINSLQWACDAFVSLHRSEGFGLWIAECMARGKPCIVTDFSGNTDFAVADTCLPIGYSMVPVRAGEYPYGEGQWWADPEHDHAVDAMRMLALNSVFYARIGENARLRISDVLRPSRIGLMIRSRIFGARAEMLNLPPVTIQN